MENGEQIGEWRESNYHCLKVHKHSMLMWSDDLESIIPLFLLDWTRQYDC